MGHALMENRNGLVVQAHLTPASGTAEREAAITMLDQQSPGRVGPHAAVMTRRIAFKFTSTMAADKLIRMSRLLAQA